MSRQWSEEALEKVNAQIGIFLEHFEQSCFDNNFARTGRQGKVMAEDIPDLSQEWVALFRRVTRKPKIKQDTDSLFGDGALGQLLKKGRQDAQTV